MSIYVATQIHKPKYFRITKLQRGHSPRNTVVIGFDSESDQDDKNRPFLFQFAYENEHCDLIPVPRFEGLSTFLTYLARNCTNRENEYIVYGFNLAYEYTQLFAQLPDDAIMADNIRHSGKLPDGTPYMLEALNVKREAISIYIGTNKRAIRVIDAMAFFPTSLDKAAKMLGLGRKEQKPERFLRSLLDDPAFMRYAKQDAILTQKLGQIISNWHVEYDVSQCISAPHFAGKVFRRWFLRKEIPLPNIHLEQAGLESYHGGKNGFYLDKPRVLRNIHHVDIRSAYPEAMRQLPDPELSTWSVSDYVHGAHALWHVKGRYTRCKYRGLMDMSTWVDTGEFDAVVTGYELDAALDLGEIEVTSCIGWIMDGPPGGALAEYVDKFYAQKRDATDAIIRTNAKLNLNSLYGKFFQKVELGERYADEDDDGTPFIRHNPDASGYLYKAGGLYHPPIASLITGFVRAKIHRLEHRFDSIMTSTDGFFCRKPPPDEMLGNELGQLSNETGTLRIWRERLYHFRAKDGTITAALHGFRGKVADLLHIPMVAGNLHHYTALSLITLKLARKAMRGEWYEPGQLVTLPYVLALPGPAP